MNIGKYWILALVVIGLTAIAAQAQIDPAVQMISAEELKTKVTGNQPIILIDVRSSQGYANSSNTMKGAIHFKLRKLKSRLAFPPFKDLPKDREIVTYCACPNDEASIAAAQILLASGFKRVSVLKGGWQGWLRANGPVEPRAKT